MSDLDRSSRAHRAPSSLASPTTDHPHQPGKRSLTQAIQRLARAGGPAGPDQIEAAAQRGVDSASTSLPFLDAISASFGRHDVSGVQAHVGPEASQAARDMDAAAFATGNHVVLGDASLHTVAHEAAHVVQQRAGVHCKTGDDDHGDAWERHADQVADAVVAGRSAEPLLDRLPAQDRGGGSAGVQRMKLTNEGNYTPFGGDHDTADRAAFAAWVDQLQMANDTATLQRALTALHRTVFQMRDHEAIARSLVQRALDHLAAPAPAPAAGAQPGVNNLPRDQWWKMFIEGVQHNPAHGDGQNAMQFDNDQSPGFYAAMSGAFEREVAGTDGHQLDFDDYDRMHRDVTQDTLRRTGPGQFEPVPHALSAHDVSFPMTHGELPNPVALDEMLADNTLGLRPGAQQPLANMVGHMDAAQLGVVDNWRDLARGQHEAGHPIDTAGEAGNTVLPLLGRIYQHQGPAANYSSMLHINHVQATDQRQLMIHTNRDPAQARGEVNNLFATYYAQLAAVDAAGHPAAHARTLKLREISRLVRALHVGHYFHDANGRLNTMILLNRLLVDAGFGPVIMERTDIFGGSNSADQLADAIRVGLQRFANEVGAAHAPPPALGGGAPPPPPPGHGGGPPGHDAPPPPGVGDNTALV